MPRNASTLLLRVLLAAAVIHTPTDSLAQNADGRQAVQAAEQMLMDRSDAAIDSFVGDMVSSAYAETMSDEAFRQHLATLRAAVAGAGGLDIARENDVFHLIFSEGADATVVLRLSEEEPGKIDFIGLQEDVAGEELSPPQKLNAARRSHVRAIEGLGRATDDAALDGFADKHLSEAVRDELGHDALIALLHEIRDVSARAGGIMVRVEDNGSTRISLRGSQNADVIFRQEEAEPYAIVALDLDRDVVAEELENVVEIAPVTWDNYADRLMEEAVSGFAGTVLVVRDGEIAHHEAYGMASRERSAPNTTETIYGIGSTPIDFTRAAILRLADQGKLRLSDVLANFFDDVPDDKMGITIDHLMSGRSGLPNFHHLADVDDDYDLSWIDREEAIRRMFAQRLLFEPGSDRSHSHSAFTLLAAIVEVVSGRSYADFVRSTFFEPIGMRHTGLYGKSPGFADEQHASGYGQDAVGDTNIPPQWGDTSWLVMGSGGMVSNPNDMLKWLRAMKSGDYLSAKAQESYWHGGVLAGSSDRGFFMMYVDDPDNTVIVSSNVHGGPEDRSEAVARALVEMVLGVAID